MKDESARYEIEMLKMEISMLKQKLDIRTHLGMDYRRGYLSFPGEWVYSISIKEVVSLILDHFGLELKELPAEDKHLILISKEKKEGTQ